MSHGIYTARVIIATRAATVAHAVQLEGSAWDSKDTIRSSSEQLRSKFPSTIHCFDARAVIFHTPILVWKIVRLVGDSLCQELAYLRV